MQKCAVNSTILLHKNTDHPVGWLLQQEWANNLKLLQAISRSRAKSESIQTPWQKCMMWTHQERELTQCEFALVEGSTENSQNWKMCAFFRNSSCCHKATVLTSQEESLLQWQCTSPSQQKSTNFCRISAFWSCNKPYYLRFISFSWASSKSSLTYKHSTMNYTMA